MAPFQEQDDLKEAEQGWAQDLSIPLLTSVCPGSTLEGACSCLKDACGDTAVFYLLQKFEDIFKYEKIWDRKEASKLSVIVCFLYSIYFIRFLITELKIKELSKRGNVERKCHFHIFCKFRCLFSRYAVSHIDWNDHETWKPLWDVGAGEAVRQHRHRPASEACC